jgi:hypothetical protein
MKNMKQFWFPRVLALALGIIYLYSYISSGSTRDTSSEILIATVWISLVVSVFVKKKIALYYLITNLIGLMVSIVWLSNHAYDCYVPFEGFLYFILWLFIPPILLITFSFFLCSKTAKEVDEDKEIEEMIEKVIQDNSGENIT